MPGGFMGHASGTSVKSANNRIEASNGKLRPVTSSASRLERQYNTS